MSVKPVLMLTALLCLTGDLGWAGSQELWERNGRPEASAKATTYYFAPGSILYFSPSEAITKKPKVFAVYTDPVKGKLGCKAPLRVVDKISSSNPSTRFRVMWVKPIKLYDKNDFKGKTISAELTNDPNLVEDLILDELNVGGYSDFDATFLYQKPSITSVEGTAAEGEKIVVTGKSFGVKPPTVSIEFTDAKGGTKYKKCKIDKTGFIYQDVKGKDSAMDPDNGQSQVTVYYPKMKATDVPTGYVILDNKSGICCHEISGSTTTANLTMAVSPADSGATDPEAGTTTEQELDQAITITATAASGYTFTNWTADQNADFADATAASTTVTLSGDATVTAYFEAGGGGSSVSFGGIQLGYASASDQVELDWAAAKDEDDSTATFTYYVYQGTEDDVDSVYQDSNLVATVNDATEKTVTGLTANTEYYFLVVAENSGGETNDNHQLSSVTTMASSLEVDNEPVDMDNEISGTITVSTDEKTVTVDADVSSTIASGDIIILPGSDDLESALKKVSTVSVSGGVTTITVEDGSLGEVIKSGELCSAATLSDPDALPEESARELAGHAADGGVHYQVFLREKRRMEERGRTSYLDPGGRFLLVKERGDDTVSLTTGLSFSPILKFEPILKTIAQWEERTLAPDRLLMAAVFFGGKLTIGGKLEFKAEASVDTPYSSGKKYLWSEPRTMKFRYVVAGVPVYQEVMLNFVCEADFQPKAALEMTSEMTLAKEVKCAIRWTKDVGWATSKSDGFEKKVEYSLKVKGGATMNIKIYPEVSTRFYRTLTGTLAVKPKLTLAAELEADALDILMSQFTKFDLGIGADVQMGAKFGIFSKNLIDKETDDIEILAPINFFGLPTVEFDGTQPSSGDLNEELSLKVKLKDGAGNKVDSTSCTWFAQPSDNVTFDTGSLTSTGEGTYSDSSKFQASADGSYNVYYAMYGAGFLGEMGKRIVKTEITIGNKIVTFEDDNLKSVVQTAVDAAIGSTGNELSSANLAKITTLDASGQSIEKLGGLEYCASLTNLNLASNKISDIGELSSLTKLTELSINGNSISDISSLSSLSSLQKLNIQYNSSITDISVLGNLTNLTELKIGQNGSFTDVSALADLSKLTLLWIQSQELPSDALSHIAKLTGLSYSLALTNVTLGGSQLSDISELSTLTSLQILNLYDNAISDVGKLPALTSLTSLSLSKNTMSDLVGLKRLTALEDVYITYCDNLVPAQEQPNGSFSDPSDITDLLQLSALKKLWTDNQWQVKNSDGTYKDPTIQALAAKGVELGP